MSDSLIFPVFDALRKRGFPLGISEYAAALNAACQGFHMESPERFRNFLCLLWAKNRDDQAEVNRLFDEMVVPRLRQLETERKGRAGVKEDAAGTDDGKAASGTEIYLEQVARRLEPGDACSGYRLGSPGRPDIRRPRYRMTPKPQVRMRQAARVFHRYARPLRIGRTRTIDVRATVDRICQTGILDRPVFCTRRVNLARLLILVDNGGSMVPFGISVTPLLDALTRHARIPHIRVRYFHDCPTGRVYQTPGPGKPEPFENALALPSAGLGVLIISDAGAARGDYDGDRVEETGRSLFLIRNRTPRMAWINPVRPDRWPGTTAMEIARMIPMFPLTRPGLEACVNTLRGMAPVFYPEVS